MQTLQKRRVELETSECPTEPVGESAADLALVKRVQEGERAAFDLLVLKYQGRIMKVVKRFISDQSEALDVAQETFIRAYRSVPGFRGDSAFYTWLHRIAINTAKNYASSTRRRTARSVDLGADVAEEGWPWIPDFDTPESFATSEELKDTIDNAVDALPDEMRTALVLREVAGLSYAEIAQVTDCPVGTVRSRIFRARQAVDSCIEPLLRATAE